MSLDDAIERIIKLSPAPHDVLVLTTANDVSEDFKRNVYQAMHERGLFNLLIILWDESDMLALSEEDMAKWGWMRIDRMKAILENLPHRKSLEHVDIEHLGAGS